jgi:tetratricopeptide (TPR) repeat protein
MPSTIEGLAIGTRESSADFTRRTWSWIREHPGAWMNVMLRKTYGVLNTSHASTPFSYSFYAYDAGTLLRFLLLGPWLFVPLGLVGLARAPRFAQWFALAYAASIVIFFVTERYKLPLYVVLVICAGALTRKGLIAAAVLMVMANWPLHLDDGRYEERLRMAEYEASRGNVFQTQRWADDSPRGEYALGRALMGAGRYAEAIPHLRRARAPFAGFDLAVALQQAGDPRGALDALRSVKAPPDSPREVWVQMGRKALELGDAELAEKFFQRAK